MSSIKELPVRLWGCRGRRGQSVMCCLLHIVQERSVGVLLVAFYRGSFLIDAELPASHPSPPPSPSAPGQWLAGSAAIWTIPGWMLYLQAQSTRWCKANETPVVVVVVCSAYQTWKWTAQERTFFLGIFHFCVQPKWHENVPLRLE